MNKSGKNAPMSCCLSKKIFIVNQVRKNAEPISSTAIQEMALFLKQFLVGHVQKVGGAHDNFLRGPLYPFLLQLVSFTVDGDPL